MEGLVVVILLLIGAASASDYRRRFILSDTSGQSPLPPTDCFYSSQRYKGGYSNTISGKACLNWEQVLTKQDPLVAGIPDSSLTFARNKCRDPDNRGHPWCFISSDNDWEYCPVPYCAECYYQNASKSYNGYRTTTATDATCDPWINHREIPISDSRFPTDGTVAAAENYCRDAYNFGVPGCWANGAFQPCNISLCDSPCEDDPSTNCSLVAKFICQDEYTRHTLCPKTCNACNFGLSAPRMVTPPADLCKDEPAANCLVLQNYICDNPEGAIKFCPKTCKKCGDIYNNAFSTSTTQKPTTTVITTPAIPHWLEWSAYQCIAQGGACIRVRTRNCSTRITSNCTGPSNSVHLCSVETCPGAANTVSHRRFVLSETTAVAPLGLCQDISPTSCQLLSLQDPTFCSSPNIANHTCRETCGTCSNSVAASFTITASRSGDVAPFGTHSFTISCTYTIVGSAQLHYIILARKRGGDNEFNNLITFPPPGSSSINNYTTAGEALRARTVATGPTPSSPTASLRFSKIDCDDKAEYLWLASYSGGVSRFARATVELVVNAKATSNLVLDFNPTTGLKEGDEVTFTCTGDVGNAPVGSLAWFYYTDGTHGGGTDVSSQAIMSTPLWEAARCSYRRLSTLRLTLTRAMDMMVMRCTVQQDIVNEHGDFFMQTNSIPVSYPPSLDPIVSSTGSFNFTEGDTATFTCSGTSKPSSTFYWIWHALVSDTADSVTHGNTVTVTNMTRRNSGRKFTCVAYNTIGGRNYTVDSTVQIFVSPSKSVQSGQFPLPSTDCFYSSQRYEGGYSFTISGKTCLNWDRVLTAQGPLVAGIPDSSVTYAHNKCRDPDNRGHPWCFTSTAHEWEFCPVPLCAECYYGNASRSYNGYVITTVTDEKCEPWSNNRHIPISDSNFPLDGSVDAAQNYCRDAYGLGKPGCWANGNYRQCNISVCASPCEDDPVTNCHLVQKYVCQDEYTSHTLCPKTCNACNFGLLPAKTATPPPVMCEDDPAANCPLLQNYICVNPEGAIKLCPKTCNKCDALYGHTITTSSTIIKTPTTPVRISTTATHIATTVTSTAPPTTPVTTTPTTTTPATTTPAIPHWLEWSAYQCTVKGGVCVSARTRNCSTSNLRDCTGHSDSVRLCTIDTCPDLYTQTTSVPTTTENCSNSPDTRCSDKDILELVCTDPDLAGRFCKKSCGLCGTGH